MFGSIYAFIARFLRLLLRPFQPLLSSFSTVKRFPHFSSRMEDTRRSLRHMERRPHLAALLHEDEDTSFNDRLPHSSYRITPYGEETTYPYGHYERPVNAEGPLDDVKLKYKEMRCHKPPIDEADCSSESEGSDVEELDTIESPRRRKLKKLGVL
ncbi:hypothetical protein KP509_27G010300 [Ceratopteris richardii]|uniref:Uncharacterized protein n=1 Tax=Ceratopteris richardii TaxID=49495 RepID=A0A8T2RFN2_CERRI|nr:hypothetical protein KP509_27G010300 [Ceratopteris richardii]